MTNNIEPINSDIYIFQARLSNLVSMLFTKTYLQYNDDDSVLVGGNKTLIKSSKNGDRVSDAGDNIGAFIVDDNIKTSQQINTSIVGQDDITEFGTLKTKRTKNKLDLSQLINNESATKIITRLFRLLRFNLLNLDVTENQDVVVSFNNQKIDTFNRKEGLDNKYLKASSALHKHYYLLNKIPMKDISKKVDYQDYICKRILNRNCDSEKVNFECGSYRDTNWGENKDTYTNYFDVYSFNNRLSADEWKTIIKQNKMKIVIPTKLLIEENDVRERGIIFWLSSTSKGLEHSEDIFLMMDFSGDVVGMTLQIYINGNELFNNYSNPFSQKNISNFEYCGVEISDLNFILYGYKKNGEKKMLSNMKNDHPDVYKLIISNLKTVLEKETVYHALVNWCMPGDSNVTIQIEQNVLINKPIYQTVVGQDKVTTMPLIKYINSQGQGD